MQYLLMTQVERESLWRGLEGMGAFLAGRFSSLSDREAAMPGPDGAFSPMEQCWHLADLEREGFGLRIRRLLAESDPVLPDFDGARLAQERNYRDRSLAEGIRTFQEARAQNLALLRTLGPAEWSRGGIQEAVGPITLCDVPHMMAQHDGSHRAEIAAWSPQV